MFTRRLSGMATNESAEAMTSERRAEDPRLGVLVTDVADLKKQMVLNTEITQQVRDILTSFRVIGAAAKWITALIAGGLALWHGADNLKTLITK